MCWQMVRRAAVAFVALMATTAVYAQAPSPPAAAPQPMVRIAPPPTPEAGCNSVEKPLSAGGATFIRDDVGQQKAWQPPGGEITFTVRSFVQIPADSIVIVCFRWKHASDRQDSYVSARPRHLDLTDAGRLLRVTVQVPVNLPKAPPRFSGDGEYAGLYLVPLAEVRILVITKDQLVAADASHEIGIANPFWALLMAALTVFLAFGLLSLISHRRLKRLGLGDLDPVIRIIATPDGYASLSQLQMLVWTLVVAGSAVYVMLLSGELIEVTSGTLVLLGISGAVTVGTQLIDSRNAAASGVAPSPRKPMWSDLIVSETNGRREIDVTRVQMLYFTLITAIFVVMRVLATYVIPEIPQGFQVLMGISNAVYFGSKVAQPSVNTAAANPGTRAAGAATPPAQSS
jgi:hypothetical protein